MGDVHRGPLRGGHYVITRDRADMAVFRGLDESSMVLPQSFYQKDEKGMAGGAEMAFMSTLSTTQDLKAAFDFSGGKGEIGSTFDL
jgi:hypothetical protein